MAVDSPRITNKYWCYLRDSMGNNYGTPTDKQEHNAKIIYNLLRVFGYTREAAAGILGVMQYISGLSPAALAAGSAQMLPYGGEHFADLTNTVMLAYTNPPIDFIAFGPCYTGLIRWNGITTTPPVGNQVASFAERYSTFWYNGELQIFRLEEEYIYDPTGWGGVNGTTITYWDPTQYTPNMNWSAFKNFTGTPEDAADIFRLCLEKPLNADATSIQHRRDNARAWYTYFATTPVDVQVSNIMNAWMAYLFRDSQYPYSQYDCISFVNLVRARLGIPLMTNGTNSLWRDVGGNFLWWRGTLQECYDKFGTVPVGAYLFKCYPEGTPGYETIPPQYYGDGIGNFDHIGIYTGLGLGVMQSGGYDVTPPGGFNGVHDTRTRLDESPPWWTHVAIGNNIYITSGLDVPPWLLYSFIRKKGLKNVKRIL